MTKVCDHTSVAMFVWREDKLLLIERGQEPFGYAVPAGHVDGDATFEIAAIRELKEEVGLEVEDIDLIAEGKKENPCRRADGTWHYWKLYKILARGTIKPSLLETKNVNWYSAEEIRSLANKTEQYKLGKITEQAWQESPGLEPVMHEWFQTLDII